MDHELLTVADVIGVLDVARSTWDTWVSTGRAPRYIKLPNGQLRVRRSDLTEWLEDLTQEVA